MVPQGRPSIKPPQDAYINVQAEGDATCLSSNYYTVGCESVLEAEVAICGK